MSNPFKSKKRKEMEQRAQEKLDSYVETGLKRKPKMQQTYQVRCGHCHGRKVMSNGKACLKCGGSGTITRSR